jgi:ribosomal protein S18 acetylase RimI-like enzyme
MPVSIIPATAADIDALQSISRQTFSAAFAHQNTEENMQAYLENNLSKEQLLKELATEGSEFYMAYNNRQAVGYLKLNFGNAQTDLQEPKSMEIERIYVMPDYFGKNAGKQLLDFAVETARYYNAESIWLGVWEHNLRAIRFYQKNGFSEFARHNFILGTEKQTDLLMRKDLTLS